MNDDKILLYGKSIKIYIFVIENSCRRARTSRFEAIGRAKARNFFGGLVLSYCSPSSAIRRAQHAKEWRAKPRKPLRT